MDRLKGEGPDKVSGAPNYFNAVTFSMVKHTADDSH